MFIAKITAVKGSNIAGLLTLAQKDKDNTFNDKEIVSDSKEDNKEEEAKQV